MIMHIMTEDKRSTDYDLSTGTQTHQFGALASTTGSMPTPT